MNFMGLITENMEIIIICVAVIESVLFLIVKHKCSNQQKKIRDTFFNIIKGLDNLPDRNSNQSFHDQFIATIAFLERKVTTNNSDIDIIKRNINLQLEKNTLSETFSIESLFNVCSAIVQIFPLLGILGTILALNQIAVKSGDVMKASEVIGAFVIAIDTTMLGIFFAIVFMLWEAKVLASVKRILDDTVKANTFISSALI